uniref:Uncharacterized protein n=1 Tax=Heterorhabditis bacteriophora TaxID=37862 RepID=A0A1I7WSU0_HETBA
MLEDNKLETASLTPESESAEEKMVINEDKYEKVNQ